MFLLTYILEYIPGLDEYILMYILFILGSELKVGKKNYRYNPFPSPYPLPLFPSRPLVPSPPLPSPLLLCPPLLLEVGLLKSS